jgi:hypothetical protein
MKKSRSIYIVALASLFAFSCSKLIEIPDHPINQIPESRVFNDSADIISAIAGVYSNFRANQTAGTLGSTMVTTIGGMSADELLPSYSSNAGFVSNVIPVTDGSVSTLWTSGYSNLYQMNSCINGIGSTTAVSDSLKQALVAEIKVARAFYYFQLVNLFGGVPLITATDYNITGKQGRAGVDEVYGLIRADLAEARSVLKARYPSSAGTKYRPNLYTALALSAKVFLYRQQWDSAAMMAKQIINDGLYQLESTPATVFSKSSKEVIWSLPGNGTSVSTGEGYALLPTSIYSAPAYYLNPLLLSAFEDNDLRKTAWIRTLTVSGKTYSCAQKYKSNQGTSIAAPAYPSEDYVMFRLADMYLILAEADAQLSNTTDARTNLDIVRTRAGLPAYAGTDADLLTAIYHERQIEMAFEWGNRWYDLKRTGTIDAVLGAQKPTWTSTAALLPIPSTQLIANVALTQNEGYK